MAVKKLILLFVFALTFGIVKAQCTFTANANVTINNPTSCNACDGSIIVNSVSGGISPYSYQWNYEPSYTNMSFTNRCVGEQILSIRDANNCKDTLHFNLTFPTPTITNVITSGNYFCGAAVNGSVTFSIVGGVGPYTYTLDGITTSLISTFNNLKGGSHYVQVIDALGCLDYYYFQIIDYSAASTINTVAISSPNTSICGTACNGDANAFASGGSAPYSYNWINSSLNSFSTNTSISGLCAGSYIVEVVDINGCVDSTSVNVLDNTISPISLSTSTTPNSECDSINSNGSVTITASGGVSPYTYSLNYNVFSSNSTITGLASGIYQLLVKDANACTKVTTFQITDISPSQLITTTITSTNNTLCGYTCNGTATAIASGGNAPYSYQWSNYSTNQTITGLCSWPNRYVIIKDANGCRDTASAIIVNSPSQINSYTINVTPNSSCGASNGEAVIAGIAGGIPPYTYSWDGNIIATNNSISGLSVGSHFCYVYDSNNCYLDKQFQILDVSPAALLTLTATSTDNLLCGSTCNGSITGLATGGTAPYTYVWNNGVTSATNTGLCGGGKFLTVTDANNCSKSKSFSLNNSTVILSKTIAQSNVSCGATNDGSITITSINGGTPPYSYSWNYGTYITNNSISFLSSGYTYLRIKDANDCYSLYDESIYIYGPNCGNLNGYVYHDANNNCTHDFGENPIPWLSILANNSTNQNSYGYTYNNGFYSINAPSFGSYTVSLINPNNFSPFITTYCTTSFVANITTLTPNSTNNFLIQTNSNCGLSLNNSSGFATPGLNTNINFSINNYGFVGTSGQLTYTLPEGLSYVSATPSPLSVNGNTLIFYYSNINVLTNFQDYFSINTIAATTLTIGTTIYATYAYDVNCTNVYNYSNPGLFPIFVTGPYDPNHKMVWPSQNGYEGDILLTDTELTYKVEFQNIGTAPAVNVVVIDTLSPLLDETSIRQLAASHPNNFVYNSLSRQMQWRFNNINLPDENSNPTGSIGYFTYKVKQKPTNVVGDVIKNTAHIYFDFNSAIVTNTTKSTIVEPESVNEYKQNAKKNTLFVYPNPSTGIFSLVFNANSLEKGKLIITDIAGKIVVQQDVESKNGNNVLQINSYDFSSGAYFVSIQFQEKELHQKVIIQK